jgi:hypothetical protein
MNIYLFGKRPWLRIARFDDPVFKNGIRVNFKRQMYRRSSNYNLEGKNSPVPAINMMIVIITKARFAQTGNLLSTLDNQWPAFDN